MSVFTKPIFNSLGSNYDLAFALQSIGQILNPSQTSLPRLKQHLRDLFQAKEVVLTYKGRDAIEYGLRLAGIGEGDQVITQAFTCHAIEEAISRTQATPVFVDISLKTANPSIKTLKKARAHAPKAKAVIIQHTLGIAAEIKQIKEWCLSEKLLLIEDLASSIGGVDADGDILGRYGDFVILSFGRDKIIDAVSGGAVVVRNKKLINQLAEQPKLPQVPTLQKVRDLLYPLVTWKIKAFQNLKLGSLFFWVSKAFGLLTSPIKSPFSHMSALPSEHAHLALLQLQKLESSIFHRRKIVEHYQQKLGSDFKFLASQKKLSQSSGVRFSLLVKDPDAVTSALKQQKIHISDRWYRQAVDCGNLKYTTHYQQASCPNAEKLAQQIINLPTHQQITVRDATRITQALKKVYDQLHG